ncbi:hypothetical protein PIB30_046180 [Stylosanthes scabra]|uniref:Uncharacterized protein n=1 Tax=Stylosanthes scabra TaxID=79078 RepID=A0ABU6WJT7_9FABA|nr:hypothetical protein [Stylosanthes scabra]
MGNCQAIDTATLVIQQPNGKVEKLYWPVSASEVMKGNPGHYVALLISSTTLCTSKDNNTNNNNNQNVPNINKNNNHNQPVRLTRIKLLKPTDTLVLGQVYRLISAQEVMKGLWAKKQAKMKKNLLTESDQVMKLKPGFDMDKAPARRLVEQEDKQESNKGERHGSRTTTTSSSNGGSSGTITAKSSSRTWQPSLQSISEATT